MKYIVNDMIYLNSETTYAYIPRTNGVVGNKFICENQITHDVITASMVNLSNNNTFYKVDVSSYISYFDNGQYDYKIANNNDTLECGILQFGEYIPNSTNYDTNINIIQYNG